MNTIEDRLRELLPQLADALTPEPVHADPKAVSRSVASGIDLGSAERSRRNRSGRVVVAGVAAAAVLLLVGGLLAFSRSDPDGRSDSDLAAPSAGPPPGFGVWRPIADAPIEARPYAVSAWTGTEAVFWAGSSLSRDFAYSDGAAFDPTTNSWRGLTVPGLGPSGTQQRVLRWRAVRARERRRHTIRPSAGHVGRPARGR